MANVSRGDCGVPSAVRPRIAAAAWRELALRQRALVACSLFCVAPASLAQTAPGDVVVIDPITVTATRRAERAFDVPASVDTIDGATIHDGQPQVNLSETLVRDSGRVRGESPELRAGPADQLARLRRARRVRRARRAALPGRHPGRRCPTGRARPAASACCPRSASKCCAGRFRRSTATRRAA